ncbi:hypothetical protein B0H21DRAFT_2492 [Amylocystis lapponica]|nr:hypothetical protein B0H21DRAFT_2492 [Amylocystis lapponica]
MAQPSSSHRERTDRSERSSRHHHHRTISSTTLLLVLSLVLAVLAIMLSLPSSQGPIPPGGNPGDPSSQGVWSYLTPKRSQALIARESNVAMREAEVARREAELLAGAPGGVIPTAPAPIVCPACPTVVEKVTEPAPPVQTVIKEVVKEAELTPPGWWDQARVRAEDILDRELKIAEREREIGRREEAVNRREHDASRRESWIMEQLVALNNEEQPTVEEEYVYEPAGSRRKPKAPPFPQAPPFSPYQALPPPLILTETAIEIAVQTRTVTHTHHHTHTPPTETVVVPPPANTRIVPSPAPSIASASSSTSHIPRTTAVEVVVEEEVLEEEEPEEEVRTRRVIRSPQHRQEPGRWWDGW